MGAEPIRLSPTLWVVPSRSMAYNSGAFISAGRACLIDPGPHPDEVAALADLVAAEGAVVETIVLTHSHWDHLFGPERLPEAAVLAHKAYPAEVAVAGEQLGRMVARWEGHHGYQRQGAFAAPRPDELLADSDQLVVGDLTLQVIHVPGHAADQNAGITSP